TWRSLDPQDFGEVATDTVNPGESFYFFRYGADMTINF
ncbi:MAG: hypothetical protein ACI97B_002645, partial [Verrucomicrobiales bacterium]